MSEQHRPLPLEWHGEDLILSLRVQPKAARDEFVPHGHGFKLRITAAPVEGRANAHLIRFLAKAFGVPRADVVLLSGETGRDKRLRIRAPRRIPPELEQPLPSAAD